MSIAVRRDVSRIAIGAQGHAIAVAAGLCHVVHFSRSGAALLAGFYADIVELFALVHSSLGADVAAVGLAVCTLGVIKDALTMVGGAFGGV